MNSPDPRLVLDLPAFVGQLLDPQDGDQATATMEAGMNTTKIPKKLK
jgi:hypothetical protein